MIKYLRLIAGLAIIVGSTYAAFFMIAVVASIPFAWYSVPNAMLVGAVTVYVWSVGYSIMEDSI